MSIISAGNGDWPAALPQSVVAITEQLTTLEERRATQQPKLGTRKNVKLLELNLALRVRLGIRGDAPACMEVLEDLVRKYCEVATSLMDDRAFARSLLEKADRLTTEVVPPPEYLEHWSKLRVMVLNGLAHFNKHYGRPHAALRCFDAAGKLLNRGSSVEVLELAGTHLNMCVMLSKLRKHKPALQHAQTALEQLLTCTGLPKGWDPIREGDALQLLPPAKRSAGAMLTIAYHNIGVQLEALEMQQPAWLALQAAAALGAASAAWEDRPVTRMREEIKSHAQDLASGAADGMSEEATFFSKAPPLNVSGLSRLNHRFDRNPLLRAVGFGGYQHSGSGSNNRKRQRKRRKHQGRQQRHSPQSMGMTIPELDFVSQANATAPADFFAQVQPIESGNMAQSDDYYLYSRNGIQRQQIVSLPPRPTSLPALDDTSKSRALDVDHGDGGYSIAHGTYSHLPPPLRHQGVPAPQPQQPQQQARIQRGQSRRAAVTRIQAVQRGKAGRRRVHAVRTAKAEEHSQVLTGVDAIDAWVRRSWHGAKEDAERSAAEWEAEARRIFVSWSVAHTNKACVCRLC